MTDIDDDDLLGPGAQTLPALDEDGVPLLVPIGPEEDEEQVAIPRPSEDGDTSVSRQAHFRAKHHHTYDREAIAALEVDDELSGRDTQALLFDVLRDVRNASSLGIEPEPAEQSAIEPQDGLDKPDPDQIPPSPRRGSHDDGGSVQVATAASATAPTRASYNNSIITRIGDTPLVTLDSGNPNVRLLAKLEGNNPGSSVKDRAARSMVERALERGTLRPGDTLVEPTSGNTGIALAMIGAARGLQVQLVMPASATVERVRTMRAFGAHVVLTPASEGMEGAIVFARERAAQDGFVMLDQFNNPDNPLGHFASTGPEIWRDTDGEVTHFVSAMGTTGTIMGVSRFLKSMNPGVQIVGCQPSEGSQIPGIRRWPAAFLPGIFEAERVDRIVDVAQADAEATARALASRDGVFTGMSAAGAVWAARKLAAELTSGTIVTILADRGDRYLSAALYASSGTLEEIE